MQYNARLQLTSEKTRQKLREAYEAEFAATIERAEKQIILAKHGRRLLKLLDDSPIVPGDRRPTYHYAAQARQILNDAEDDLKDWQPEQEEYTIQPSETDVKSPVSAKGKGKLSEDSTVVSPSERDGSSTTQRKDFATDPRESKRGEVLELGG